MSNQHPRGCFLFAKNSINPLIFASSSVILSLQGANKGGYLVSQPCKETAKLTVKGYTLAEGVKALGISLRTYRNWIIKNPDKLNKLIDELVDKT